MILRATLFSIGTLFAAQTALACSCVIEDEWAAAKKEYESADIVFKGYLLGQELTPQKNCSVGSVPSDPFQPIGLFKVVEADKGVSDNDTLRAKIGGVFEVAYDELCSIVLNTSDSCAHEFDAASFGTVESPKWLAFTLFDGELWMNSQNCSAFGGNGQEVVDRFSKRDAS